MTILHYEVWSFFYRIRAFRLLGERGADREEGVERGVISKGKNVCLFPSGGLHIFSF